MKRMNHCTLAWTLACFCLLAGVASCDEGISPPRPHPLYEPEEPSPLAGVGNLFHRAKVSVCDHWSDRVGAFALDGRHENRNDYWGTDAKPAWLTVELSKLQPLNTVRLWNYWDGSRSYGYLIEGSRDGTTWTTLVDRRANTRPATPQGRMFHFETQEVKLVRITVWGKNAGQSIGAHLVEFQGYHVSAERFAKLAARAKSWESVSPGLHGAFGSKDVRYVRGVAPQVEPQAEFSGTAWRGERASGQLVLWTATGAAQVRCSATALKSERGDEIPAARVRSRFVRYVLSDHDTSGKPGTCLVADVLDTIERLDLSPRSVRPVWLSIDVPASVPPGLYRGNVTVTAAAGVSLSLKLKLEVLPATLPPPAEWSFRLDLWQTPSSVAHYHGVDLWSEAHWAILKPHLQMLADAGQKFVTTYITHTPWQNLYVECDTMVEWIRQADGTFRFDYTAFDRYVELAQECGITDAITCYTMVPWGHRVRYFDESTGDYVWTYPKPGTAEYEALWTPLVKDLAKHLKQRGWFEKTYIGINENPPPDGKCCIDLLRKHAPGMKVTWAGKYHPELEGQIDDWCFFIDPVVDRRIINERSANGKTTTFYTCCGPPKPNNFTFSPPAESTWMGWYAAAEGYDGFLRWAYDTWVADPLLDTRHVHWPAGDCFLIYPGVRSSIRFERLREGIVDYEKIRILREILAGRDDAPAKEALARLDAMLKRFTYADAQRLPAAKVVADAQRLLQQLAREATQRADD